MVAQSVSLNDGTLATYSYDALGQLIRVNDPHENATWVYNYDRGGNITSKVKYAYTTGTLGTAQQTISYTCGDANWKDKLTAYNGKAITYDAIGNPLSDGTWTYAWQAGRQLKQMSKTGTTIRYEYNHEGLRTQKFVDTNNKTDATYYTYNGKNIIHVIKNSDHLHIFYDAQNRPAKVSHNGIFYTYLYNLQGDVVGLLDKNGVLVVEYKYDAWGKPLSITGTLAATLGKLNPFRYRGYVYDEEIGLYYLCSRYYSWLIGRFINVDAVLCNYGTLLANNAFTYCKNDSINKTDHDGYASDGTVLTALPLPEQPPQEVIDLFTEFGVEMPDTGGFGYGFVGYASYGWGTVVTFSKDKISSEGKGMVAEKHSLEYLFARPNQSGIRSFYREYKDSYFMQSILEWKDKHDTLQDIFDVIVPALEGNWGEAGCNLLKIIGTGTITDGIEQSIDGFFSRVRIRKTVQKTYYDKHQKIIFTEKPWIETTYIW